MKFGSVCSGIEAASVAWEPLGWSADWLSEIEPFPAAVLNHHWPEVPNLGDMTTLPRRVLTGEIPGPDILVGGTPCQAFSVAGMREGLNDERGQLTIKYVELLDAIDFVRRRDGRSEAIAVWENVPGILSDRGNAFGCFLGALAGEDCELKPAGKKWTNAGCVYGPERAVAWRVLDAQYFGVAQRRRRVFVVASARKDFDPAAVLFERESMRRDSAPSRAPREEITGTLSSLTTGGGGLGTDFECSGGLQVVGTPIVTAFSCKDNGRDAVQELAPTLRSMSGERPNGGGQLAVAFAENSRAEIRLEGGDGQITGCLSTGGGKMGQGIPAVAVAAGAVRRLMPVECERLQKFPDNHTKIPWRGKPADLCPDGPRYRALGNSMAVSVMEWLGMRIGFVLEMSAI